MKRFDKDSIKTRMLTRARANADWALISDNSVISNIFDTISDALSETARYSENLITEKKWDTAQNLTSLTTQASLVGYKPKRMISSTGTLIVSHPSISNNVNTARLANYGISFFNLDDPSDYDNSIDRNSSSTASEKAALIPWWWDPYTINEGAEFATKDGITFIAISSVKSRKMTQGYNTIKEDSTLLASFNAEGGWNGIKYVEVPVIQGIKKQVTYTNQNVNSVSNYTIYIDNVVNIENASTVVSRKLFTITVNGVSWYASDNLYLAGVNDRVFQVINKKDLSGIAIKFGNGINGIILPADSTVIITYLETLGFDGNVYAKNKVIFPVANTISTIDPRTNKLMTLEVTNITSLLGGEKADISDTIREKAPLEYLKYYTISTQSSYERLITQYSQIGILLCKVYGGEYFDSSTQTTRNVLYVTVIGSDGEKLTSPDSQLIKPISLSLGDLKSPTDSLVYIEPEFLKLKLNVIIYTKDRQYSDNDVISQIQTNVLNKYSIYNTQFKNPFYSTELIKTLNSASFVEYSESFVEAVVDLDYSKVSQQTTQTTYRVYFSFPKIYGEDKSYQGLKTSADGSIYLLKAEMKVLTDSTKNRTFFLLDKRVAQQNKDQDTGLNLLNIEDAKKTCIDGTLFSTKYPSLDTENSNNFQDRQVRVAQFPILNEVTDTKTMNTSLLTFTNLVREFRPSLVDSSGNIVITNLANSGTSDLNYLNGFDIGFNEIYDTSKANFAVGYIDIPINTIISSTSTVTQTNLIEATGWLKQNVSIKIMAKPKLENIVPSEWNQIVFTDLNDIEIERQVTWNSGVLN